MDCYVGASSGALKGIDFSKCKVSHLNTKDIKLLNPIVDEITAMCFMSRFTTEEDREPNVLTCHGDRQVCHYNAHTQKCARLFKVSTGKGVLKAVQYIKGKQRVVIGVESGEIALWNVSDLLNSLPAETSSSVNSCVTSWSSGNNLMALCLNPHDNNLVASGGARNPLKVWDLSSGKAIFTAKNVRQDSLELEVPIWETNLCFVDGNSCLATATKAHQIRLYDPRVQRRPIFELEWLEEPILALSTCFRDCQLLAGNTRGELALFDMRQNVQLVKKFRGFAGSIRFIDAHPTEPIFVSCGIDRFVIAHNINSKAILKKVFCKVALNSVLLSRENSLINKPKKKKLSMEVKEEKED